MEDRIREEFLPHEAKAILSLPLSFNGKEDRLIWAETANGYYTTKSAYRLLLQAAEAATPGTSNSAAEKPFWQELWSLNVPNKIRHFLWRAANDSLPTKKNLQKRNIIQDTTCERCGGEIEDGIHAIWGCQMIKQVWWELEKCREFLNENFASFRDLLQGILAQKNLNVAELFAFIGWSIWHDRNARRLGSHSLPIEKIYRDAVERLREFHSVREEQRTQLTVHHPTHWLPPSPSVYKVNFDGATFPDIAAAGLGVVVRDLEGLVIAALSE